MNPYLINGQEFGWGPGVAKLNPDKAKLLYNYAIGSVLDIACGSGIYANYLFSQGHDVTGVDLQEEFTKSAAKTYPKISFLKGSAEKLPFKNSSFQTAILFDILEHLDDEKVIKEAFRVAKRLIISVPMVNDELLTQYGLSHAHYLDRTHLRVYNEESLRKLFKKLKLKVIFLQPSLPISLSGILIQRLSHGNYFKKLILKIILKPFLPEPPLYSTLFAVVEKP